MAAAGMAVGQDAAWETAMGHAMRAERNSDYPQAVAFYREARALADSFGPSDPRRWATYNQLGTACELAGLTAESVRTYREVISLVKSSIGTNNRTYATMVASLGTAFLNVGEFASAENLLREAREILLHLEPVRPVEIAMAQSRLGEALVNLRRRAEAEQMIEAALPVLQNGRAEAIELAIALNNLGVIRRQERRYDEAAHLLAASLDLVERQYGREHPWLLLPLNNLAIVYEQVGRDSDADATFRRAQEICEKHLPPAHPSHTTVLTNYAAFLRHTGEKSRAKVLDQEARELNRDNARAEGLGRTVDVSAFRPR
jgi:tetratricopeptide (TPR) repeat protein